MTNQNNPQTEADHSDYDDRIRPQKSAPYYIDSFSALEKENKKTFNFAACLFTFSWMIYRKMYFGGVLVFIVRAFLGVLGRTDFDDYSVSAKIAAIALLLEICLRVAIGFYANSFYLSSVKQKIREGYHLVDEYSATSWLNLCCVFTLYISSSALVIGCSPVFILVFFAVPISMLVPALLERILVDKKLSSLEDNLKAEDFKFYIENVKRYLDPAKKDDKSLRMLLGMASLLLLVTCGVIFFTFAHKY